MANGNPFYVAPPNLVPAMQGLGQVLREKRQADEQRLMQQQKQRFADITRKAVGVYQLPQEQRRGALAQMSAMADRDGDVELADDIGQLLNLDDAGLEAELSGFISNTPYGRQAMGRQSQFAKQGAEDSNIYKDAKNRLFKIRTVYDPNTDEYTARATPIGHSNAQVGDLSLASKKGLTSDEDAAAAAAQAEATQTAKNIANKGAAADQEEQKKLGQLRGDITAVETENWRSSKSQALQLSQLENALNAAETGKYAQVKTFLGKYAPGIDVSSEEALQSIITSYALSELQKQKGPKTDFDFIKAAETQIQSGNTKAANKIILERMKENQRYSSARWDAWRDFKKGGGNAEDFEDFFEYEPGTQQAPSVKLSDQELLNKYGLE
jgi:hypothetical protein